MTLDNGENPALPTNEKGDQKQGPEKDMIPLPVEHRADVRERWAEFNPPEPTISDGWTVVANWRRTPDYGIEVTELTLKPTLWVVDGAPSGFARRRILPEESPPRGIDKAAIGLLSISKIREGLREFVERSASDFREAAEKAAKSGRPSALLEGVAEDLEGPVRRSRGRPPKSSTELAVMASQVLQAIEDKQKLYETLASLWGVEEETVQNFWLPKLRSLEYLDRLGRAMVPGEKLRALLEPEIEDDNKRKEIHDG